MPSKQPDRTVRSQRPQTNSRCGQRLLETPEALNNVFICSHDIIYSILYVR